MKTIRTGVVGVGHMGINHARIYSELPGSQLTAVYDTNAEATAAAARNFNCRAASSLEEFSDLIDAATVCTPTVTHHSTGMALLGKGKHLLIEKPIADTPAHARELAEAAARLGCILQVGHVERFNPVLHALESQLQNPRFLEVTRLSPYPNRSTDIGVVLD
ncbi:MAG: Gfo/Idh/MocA family oxidoreductase, partial [Spartobacteria bacterium]